MEELLNYLKDNYEQILVAAGAVVTAASAIANLTPTESDNKAVAFLSKVVNFFALNFKKK